MVTLCDPRDSNIICIIAVFRPALVVINSHYRCLVNILPILAGVSQCARACVYCVNSAVRRSAQDVFDRLTATAQFDLEANAHTARLIWDCRPLPTEVCGYCIVFKTISYVKISYNRTTVIDNGTGLNYTPWIKMSPNLNMLINLFKFNIKI